MDKINPTIIFFGVIFFTYLEYLSYKKSADRIKVAFSYVFLFMSIVSLFVGIMSMNF